uniref:Uncharacterized protein n=1 Tax=viral metagenome TaxID=1070528 RepID=A0A6C0I4Q5_9ZZZZ
MSTFMCIMLYVYIIIIIIIIIIDKIIMIFMF